MEKSQRDKVMENIALFVLACLLAYWTHEKEVSFVSRIKTEIASAKEDALGACKESYGLTIPLTLESCGIGPLEPMRRFSSERGGGLGSTARQAEYIIGCMETKGYRANRQKCSSFDYIFVSALCFDPNSPS